MKSLQQIISKFEHELTLDTDKITNRETYIGEHSGTAVEGGALNANYKDVEAVAIVCNTLGKAGLEYGKDFVWENCGCDELTIRFKDAKLKTIEKLRW